MCPQEGVPTCISKLWETECAAAKLHLSHCFVWPHPSLEHAGIIWDPSHDFALSWKGINLGWCAAGEKMDTSVFNMCRALGVKKLFWKWHLQDPQWKGSPWLRVIRSSPAPMPVPRFQWGAQDQGGLGMRRHACKRSGDFLETENPHTNHHCYLESAVRVWCCSKGLTVFYFAESSKPPNVLLGPQFFLPRRQRSLW